MRLRHVTAQQLEDGYLRLLGFDEDGTALVATEEYEVIERLPDGTAVVVSPR